MKQGARFAVASVLVLAAGCSTNTSGDFAASDVGDLSHPLAERGAPDALERAACGDGALRSAAAAGITRRPTLQRVSDRGARILWASSLSVSASVELSTPDGERIAAVPAAVVADGMASGTSRVHEAILQDLEPDTLYCYTIAHDGEEIAARAGFRTAPAAGSGARVTFAAFGDSGHGGADQEAVRAQLGTVPFRFMLHTGDIAYETGTLDQFERTYFQVYAPLLQSFAMFPTRGNHDDEEVYRRVFDLPRAPKTWYSFDHGDIHFVSLETNHSIDAQAEWLEADLADSDRPWTVVFGHHPPYSSGDHGSDLRFRDTFGPILERHRVDLVLSGHDHHYERVVPQNGVHYVVTGGGGRGTRPVSGADFTAFSDQVLHLVYVEVEGDQLLLHAIDATGEEFDQLLIDRSAAL